MKTQKEKLENLIHTSFDCNLPLDFNISAVEEDVIGFFLNRLQKELSEAYFENPSTDIIESFLKKADESYLGRLHNHGQIFTANCYDKALCHFRNELKAN
ncbi:MAG: hypothetical protein AABY22_08145 [Nanoarchaeota archaeon]